MRAYVEQLFSAAIQSSVARSEMILGKANVFKVATSIGTFDFAPALELGLGVDYENVLQRFETWFAGWLGLSSGRGARLARPSPSNVPMSPAVIRDLDDRIWAQPSIHLINVESYETAILNHRAAFQKKYRTLHVTEFRAIRSTNILQFDFDASAEAPFIESDLGCSLIDNLGNSLPFTLDLQKLGTIGDLIKYRIFFLCNHPLNVDDDSGPYHSELRYEAPDPFGNFGKLPEIAGISVFQGDADQVTLGVAFPRVAAQLVFGDIADLPSDQLENLDYALSSRESVKASQELPSGQFSGLLNLEQRPENYIILGRRAKDVRRGQNIGMVIGPASDETMKQMSKKTKA